MHKKKKVKTIIIEKFKYDNDDMNYGVNLAPELLLKLLEFARTESVSDVQLHAMVTRAHILAHEKDCLHMEDYAKIISVPSYEVVSSNTEWTEEKSEPVPATEAPAA